MAFDFAQAKRKLGGRNALPKNATPAEAGVQVPPSLLRNAARAFVSAS